MNGTTKADRPIFIAGCGRSGTSLLRTIVDAHPDVYIPSESLFIVDYLEYCGQIPQRLKPWLFFREPQLRCWYDKSPFEFSDCARAVRTVHEMMAVEKGASIWGQKTPRFIRNIDLIEQAFPGVRWVLVYRDPRAVVASLLQSKQHTYSVKAACDRWIRDNSRLVELMEGSARDDCLFVKYESLIEHYAETVNAVFTFLGLDTPSMEYIEDAAEPVFFSRSRFSINTVRNGVRPDRAGLERWQEALTEEDVSYIEARCGPLMDKLGYSERRGKRHPPHEWRYLGARAGDVRVVFRYLRHWPEYLLWSAFRYTLLRVLAVARR